MRTQVVGIELNGLPEGINRPSGFVLLEIGQAEVGEKRGNRRVLGHQGPENPDGPVVLLQLEVHHRHEVLRVLVAGVEVQGALQIVLGFDQVVRFQGFPASLEVERKLLADRQLEILVALFLLIAHGSLLYCRFFSIRIFWKFLNSLRTSFT